MTLFVTVTKNRIVYLNNKTDEERIVINNVPRNIL